MLRRSDLVMLCLGKDAELPELIIKIHHEVRYTGLYNTEIVIIHFLALRRHCSEQGSAGVFEVRSF